MVCYRADKLNLGEEIHSGMVSIVKSSVSEKKRNKLPVRLHSHTHIDINQLTIDTMIKV